ncbi:MAG: metallophosphatase [Acidobacteria bacterium]|nr:metallophosphatase [Acidobacteriota bacterium]
MSGLRILQLSDLHVRADGAAHNGVVETVATLKRAIVALDAVHDLDLVVVSGDVSDDGSAESYRLVQSVLTDFATTRGRPQPPVLIYAMGNHDQRLGFSTVLGNGHPPYSPVPRPDQPAFGSTICQGVRILTVDSSVPEFTHGSVCADQLQWLRQELTTPAEHGSILVIHHPPVPPTTPLHHGIELQNAAELLAACIGSDVQLILSGHYHHALVETVNLGNRQIPVVVTPGVVNVNDTLAKAGHERATAQSGATEIQLRCDGSVRIQTAEWGNPEQVFDLDPDAVADISARIRVPGIAP